MNDTPGWASPGSPSSGEQGAGVPRPAPPSDGPAGAGWSTEQPPAGHWSAPGGPGGPVPPPAGPPPAWGGRPGPGGWGAPPAAKPGVIPLRPLGVGEILDGAFATLRAHWRTVLAITVAVSVLAQIGETLVQRYLVPVPPALGPDPTPAEALENSVESLRSTLIGLGPSSLIVLMATLFTSAPVTVIISRSVLGRSVTLAEAWREARPRLPQLLALTLLLPLLTAVLLGVGVLPGLLLGSRAGLLLSAAGGLAGGVAALWLMIRLSLSTPALMLERQGVTAALKRSAKLVQGAWWRVFGVLSLTGLLTFLASMIIAIPFTAIAYAVDGNGLSGLAGGTAPEFGWSFLVITGIGAVITSALTYPISAGVTALLYVDQRIRREALDLELARAAGLSGYGSPAGEAPGN
ncbi:hypothetical protein NX801_10260 [Streptomyces sp. LP05-1]|uniref:Glycerophosphoryl diester phosphodiesterase membrane domain-containing protein n=1 Tax=Streptomyces pyxinae TaxID=2970734 RepID=A0ABT2CF55_9ACTN|nr:hypothetical protein [Streptomyces sp. LP05-1]MCS0636040.1 hypothetical protein [Streptomyces sp. LP05-1]